MNEEIKSRDLGIETRVLQFTPEELEHLSNFNTDRSFREYVARNSYKRPTIQAWDILDMQLEGQASEKLPARMTVELARGHRELATFALLHTGWEHNMVVYETGEDGQFLLAECHECHESLQLLPESLRGDEHYRKKYMR